MRMLRRTGLRLARSRAGGLAVWLITRWVPWLIPGRVFTDAELVVVGHPVPSELVHLLVLPRRPLADAHDQGGDAARFWNALSTWAQHQGSGFGVCVGVTNVGSRQDVPLLHIHLIDRRPPWVGAPHERAASADRLADAVRCCVRHTDLRARLAAGGSYGFEIAAAGAPWSVWAQAASDPSI